MNRAYGNRLNDEVCTKFGEYLYLWNSVMLTNQNIIMIDSKTRPV